MSQEPTVSALTNPDEAKTDSAREQILRAAAHQFARRSYSLVSLDDILSEAKVTKGAMYFHFRSKHALALAIIETQTGVMLAGMNELLANKMSGLETLIDFCYFVAVRELTDDLAKASLNLLEAIGRTDNLMARLFGEWIDGFAQIARRAAKEGDLLPAVQPEEVSRLLVALYAGVRQVTDLDNPEHYLHAIQGAWHLILPGIMTAERVGYFIRFVDRRTTAAIRKVTA
jgi:TetR/AcrR family transcriptional regulator, transcriptional repressor for nem operon